jgi:hypothetical protein
MLYPSDKAMNAAFQHVWVKQVARPKASLGCPRHSFASAVCNYWIGNSHAAAGQFVRFLFRYSVDSYLIPSVAWTSDRDGIISYLAGTKTNDTQQVLNYWATGAPGPS